MSLGTALRTTGRQRLASVVAGMTIAFCVHRIAAQDAIGPMWYEDEIGYLMNSRAMVEGGSSVRIGPMGFYSGGWSVVLVPLTILVNDPHDLYQAALILMSAIGALHVLPLTWLAENLAGIERRFSVAAATVVAIYPGRALMAGYLFTEAFFSLCFLVALVTVARWIESRSALSAMLAGVSVGWLYSTHGRGLAPVVALLVAFLGASVVWRSLRPTAGLMGLVVTVVTSELLNRWLKSNLYELRFDRLSEGLGKFLEVQPRSFVATSVGALWYVAVSSFGLAAIGCAVLVGRSWRAARERDFTIEQWYVMTLAFVAALTIPGFSWSVAAGDRRLDYLIYGRHWDAVISFALLVGIGAILRAESRHRLTTMLGVASAGVVALAGVLKVVSLSAYLEGLPLAAALVAGIAPWIDLSTQRIPLAQATGATVLSLIVLGVLPYRASGLRLVLLALVFVGMTWFGEINTMRPLDRPWQRMVSLQNEVADLDVESVAYDTNGLTRFGRNGYAYWLGPYDQTEFSSENELPDADIVIARHNWSGARQLGALPLFSETGIDETLWILPGSTQDALVADGAFCREERVHSALINWC